ncbi:MAG TPA: mechanosensitive ion channel family protein [Steroidobacteraceae bacterium]|nr:mechanosensitive ion channel family protein [Steroidobacteraceae bacterium]
MADTLETIEQVRTTAVDLAMKFGPKLLAALLILALGYFIGRWMSRWLERALGHVEMEPPVRTLIVRIARAAISVLFVIMALQNLGVELLPLIAGLGVAGAGIALAMQGVLGNLFAGPTIILTKPFRIGEYIEIVSEEGAVESISLFQTTLTHPDRSRVVIPNRKIVGEILHNFGQIRQVIVVVGVAYDTDLNRAIALIQETLRANGRILRDLEPLIGVSKLADSSVNLTVKPWVAIKDFGVAAGEINQAILEIFRDARIVIPFPQREIRMIAAA